MKSLMRIAFVGLLAISTVSFASDGGGGRKKAKKQACPASCVRTGCAKAVCSKMPACTTMPCGQQK